GRCRLHGRIAASIRHASRGFAVGRFARRLCAAPRTGRQRRRTARGSDRQCGTCPAPGGGTGLQSVRARRAAARRHAARTRRRSGRRRSARHLGAGAPARSAPRGQFHRPHRAHLLQPRAGTGLRALGRTGRAVSAARHPSRHGAPQHGAGFRPGACHRNRSMAVKTQYDVVVVGGGLIGAVQAVALQRAGFAVALVELRRPAEFDPDSPYDLRQSAIAPAQKRILDNLGLWDFVAEHRACPFTAMQVWEDDPARALLLEHTELGLPDLGHIIDNGLLVASAWRNLTDVDIHCPAGVDDIVVDRRHVALTLDDGSRLTAELVIGAEGAESVVRRHAGIDTTGWPYHQRCTVGAVTTEKYHRHTAWQRYTPSGPVAFLPLADGRCSLAWHA